MKSESVDAQSCPTLSDPMDCSLPGSTVHGSFQARVLEWVAIAFSDICVQVHVNWASQVALVVKNTADNAGGVRDAGSIPGLGRSPGGGHDNILKYSCLENPRDGGGVRWAMVRWVAYS